MERLRERLRAVHSLIEDVIERRVQLKQEMSQAASRHQGDLENEDRYGIAKFAKAVLEVPDNLERAVASIRLEELETDEELRHMKESVAKMQEVVGLTLEKFGVREMSVEGEVFDPQKHEAMFAAEAPGRAPNTVFHVMAPGYEIHDRTLRAARVGVVKGPAAQRAPSSRDAS